MLGKLLLRRPVGRFVSLCAIAIFVVLPPRVVEASVGGHTWREFWREDITCWYAADTIQRSGPSAIVKFICNSEPTPTKWTVFTVRIQCLARTYQSIGAEIYDAQTGALLDRMDLGGAIPETTPPNSMGAELTAIVC